MRYQICVSGASSGKTVQTSHRLAYDLGKAIVSHGKTLMTGATVGLPWFAAQGAFNVKGKRGISIGFSPASSFREHVAAYRLPTREFDFINFTGMDYVGRNIYLARSSDAVITVGGRMGSLHELTTALESRKICGVLLGSGGLADFVPELLKNIENSSAHTIVYDTDSNKLVEKVIKMLDNRYADFEHSLYDEHINSKHRRNNRS